MAKGHLIDTSAVIKYLNQTFNEKAITYISNVVDTESNISFISEIELQAWNPSNRDDIIVYLQFVQSSNIFGISPEIIASTISIRKKYKINADALIAATAMANDFILLADNDKRFFKS